MTKVGAFIITVCLFILVAIIPHQVGLLALPEDLGTFALFTRWYIGVAIIIFVALFATIIGVFFGLVYQAVLDVLNDPW